MRAFETWTIDDLQIEFNIQRNLESKLLTNWTSIEKKVDEFQTKVLIMLSQKLLLYVNTWNEDELKMQFIGPLLILVDFNTDKYKAFSQRTLTAKIKNIEVSGKVDFMVASGLQKPRTPFFFLHEYKPSRRAVNDPDGQLLIEMLAAKTINNSNNPLYGALVEGRFWYFVVLIQNEYTISRAYDATGNDIFEIYSILCKVKDYIDKIITKTEAIL